MNPVPEGGPVYLALASTPWGVDCAQVGRAGYEAAAKAECKAFAAQLARHYKANRDAAKAYICENYAEDITTLPDELPIELVTTSHPHDFGTYYIVSAKFDEESDIQVYVAYWLEANGPEDWDEEALAELAGTPNGAMTGLDYLIAQDVIENTEGDG